MDLLPKCVRICGPIGHNVRYYLKFEYLQERSADLLKFGKYLIHQSKQNYKNNNF